MKLVQYFFIHVQKVLAIAAWIMLACISIQSASAQNMPSNCAAIAQSEPVVTFVSSTSQAIAPYHVRLTFTGHSTWVIQSASGLVAATDYAGWAGEFSPNVVTMNHAHDTHYTSFPDPGISHVLRGWNPDGGKADHYLKFKDALIRNVTTDIVDGNVRSPDENSIFIFEVEGLCIGHLGHLHHQLTDSHYAAIGRLDVVMVPIDGAMTLSLEGMAEIVTRLRASVILPMHARGFATPGDFIAMLNDKVNHEYLPDRSLDISLNNLPNHPTVFVPKGL